MAETILTKIAAPHSEAFRRAYIKRRDGTTGLFESNWFEVSGDVKQWGRIRREIDNVRYSKIKFNDVMMKFENSGGLYNPSDDEASLWYGYGSQQRTLVKIESGFRHFSTGTGGVITKTEYPSVPSVFYGIISGDLFVSDDNHLQANIRPLLQIFRDFPARNLEGFTATGLTASQFMGIVRDMTDGSGNAIFRPFFGDTTTNWLITATTNVYTNLNTQTSTDIYDKNVWDVMEKLAEAEDLIIFVKNDGTFNFKNRDASTATSQYHFVGTGFVDSTHGHTVKKVTKFGKKQSDYYSRVEVRWIDSNTVTALRIKESSFTVTGSNDPWNLGHRTFKFENFWIPTVTVADTILDNIYNNVNTMKEQIEFSASFVPHLELLDRIQVSYDSSALSPGYRWDVSNWSADDTNTTDDLYWDKYKGDAIRLNQQEFKILSIDLDLDNLNTTINGIRA